ncbi:hypothetical protein GCM10009579_14650 [Streptomyces javensis]|uniref:Glycosyl hydrolase family 92 N-terminal domain-containing protein n=1 Tax=Streptomyces javensis TaxID=114698 RepID=A0ABP4HBE3_9ACTN
METHKAQRKRLRRRSALVGGGMAVAIGALLAPLVEAPAASAATRAEEVRHPVTYVDPLIGSAGGGNTYPGATLPFGMIAWSPTSTTGDQTNTAAANGYRDSLAVHRASARW